LVVFCFKNIAQTLAYTYFTPDSMPHLLCYSLHDNVMPRVVCKVHSSRPHFDVQHPVSAQASATSSLLLLLPPASSTSGHLHFETQEAVSEGKVEKIVIVA
jgi:hypothetical protein